EVGDVQNLALLIVDPDGRGLKSGDHFQKTAYSLLVGCILHLCYKAKVEGTPATFGALDRMLPIPAGRSRSCGMRCSPMVTSTGRIIPLFPPPHATCSTGPRTKPVRCYRRR